MNLKKICFITCVNDEETYSECVKYINNLEVPIGYSIDFIKVNNAESITSGYNEAMAQSDAKYKIYLHQDTLVINKRFIYDIIKIFKSNKKIGMIGCIGSKDIPKTGMWWDSLNKIGKVFESGTAVMKLLEYGECKKQLELSKAIDGLIMITQYDIKWREDLFDGWHFYDVSQSLEFIINGYEVAIPKQITPWFIHDCGVPNLKNGYMDYRKIFLKEYSKEILDNHKLRGESINGF